MVWERPPGGGLNQVSTLDFLDWKRQSTMFATLVAEDWGSMTLTDAHAPEEIRYDGVSANYFEIPNAKPAWDAPLRPASTNPVDSTKWCWRTGFGGAGLAQILTSSVAAFG